MLLVVITYVDDRSRRYSSAFLRSCKHCDGSIPLRAGAMRTTQPDYHSIAPIATSVLQNGLKNLVALVPQRDEKRTAFVSIAC